MDLFLKFLNTQFGAILINNILVIQVVLPLFMATIIFVIKNRLISWVLTSFTLFVVFLISLLMFYLNLKVDSSFQYYLGSWQLAGAGIVYQSSGMLGNLVAPLATFSSFMAVIWGKRFIENEVGSKYNYFNSALLIAVSGLLGMLFTDDLFNLFVFLEISSLSTYIILALNKENKKSYISSLNYLIIGTVAATFYIFGVGILYASTGHLNFFEIAKVLASSYVAKHHNLAFALIFTGLLMKIGIFPLNAWMAQVYKNSPTVASMFLASVATKVVMFVIIKLVVLMKVLNISLLQDASFSTFSSTMLIFGAISALVSSYLATKADNFAQMLALSSAGQIGYILMAFAIGSEFALYAATIHIVNHGIIKLSLFMTRANIAYSGNVYTFSEIKSKGFYNPLIMAGLFISGLSIIGIPGTAGFYSKYYLILSILSANNVSSPLALILIITILVSSLFAVLYVWKAIEAMWFNNRELVTTNSLYKKPSSAMNAGYLIVISLNIALVLFWFYIG